MTAYVDGLRRDLACIPDLITHVRAHVIPGPASGDKIRGTRDPAAPGNLDAIDAADRLYTMTCSWAQVALDEFGLLGPVIVGWHTPAGLAGLSTVHPADTVGVVRFLIAQLDRIAEQDWADPMAEEIGSQVAGMLAAWPWEEKPRHLPMPCPKCDRLALVRYAPTLRDLPITITCRACRHIIPEHLYGLLARVVLDERRGA